MAAKIRLRHIGSKKSPFYHIVIADFRPSRDGCLIETVSTHSPLKDSAEVISREDLALGWLSKSAQPSGTVRNILSKEDAMKEHHEAKNVRKQGDWTWQM